MSQLLKDALYLAVVIIIAFLIIKFLAKFWFLILVVIVGLFFYRRYQMNK